MLPGIFYPGVYLKDISTIYIGVYYLFFLIIGDKNTIYKR
jgi:hypothetical protein